MSSTRRRSGSRKCSAWVLATIASGMLCASPIAAEADEQDQGSEPQGGSFQSADPDPEVWNQPEFLRRVSRIRADVVRRSGGEWVIVRLALGSNGSTRTGSPSENGSRIEDQPGLQAMLREYGQAFQEQDAQRLAAVWLMNPVERKELDRLFAEMSSVDVSVSRPDCHVDGDRGMVEFDQHFVVSGLPPNSYSLRTSLQRALAAHDAYGDWSVDRVLEAR